MQIELDISFAPDSIEGFLSASISDETKRYLKDLAPEIETAISETVDNPSPSARGNPPGRRSGELYNSPRATAYDDHIVLELAEHAKYLDALFDDEYLDRSFIPIAMEKAIGASMSRTL